MPYEQGGQRYDMLPAFAISMTGRLRMKGYKNVGLFKQKSLNVPQSKKNNKPFQTSHRNGTDHKTALLERLMAQQKSKGAAPNEP